MDSLPTAIEIHKNLLSSQFISGIHYYDADIVACAGIQKIMFY
jgi:hypothetical protein